MTVGSKIDKLFSLREKKAELSQKIKEINTKYEEVEQEIINELELHNLRAAKGTKASVSVTMGFYPRVIDLEQLTRWVVRNKRFEFLQKRCSSGAIKEMFDDKNKLPPGVETHTEPKLNLRRL